MRTLEPKWATNRLWEWNSKTVLFFFFWCYFFCNRPSPSFFLATTGACWGGGEALGLWKAPRDNFDCNRRCMNKDEFGFEFNFVIVFGLLGWLGWLFHTGCPAGRGQVKPLVILPQNEMFLADSMQIMPHVIWKVAITVRPPRQPQPAFLSPDYFHPTRNKTTAYGGADSLEEAIWRPLDHPSLPFSRLHRRLAWALSLSLSLLLNWPEEMEMS